MKPTTDSIADIKNIEDKSHYIEIYNYVQNSAIITLCL